MCVGGCLVGWCILVWCGNEVMSNEEGRSFVRGLKRDVESGQHWQAQY